MKQKNGNKPVGYSSAIRLAAAACAILAFFPAVSAAGAIHANLGEVVPLSGYSYGSQIVYLFLTGPNLPANGVALDDMTRPADGGGGTRLTVDDHDKWTYKWNTGAGKLDEGVYTLWIANNPADLSHLGNADFSTISIVLARPSLSAGIAIETVAPGQTAALAAPPGTTPVTVAATTAPGSASTTVTAAQTAGSPQAPVQSPASFTNTSGTVLPLTQAAAMNPLAISGSVCAAVGIIVFLRRSHR